MNWKFILLGLTLLVVSVSLGYYFITKSTLVRQGFQSGSGRDEFVLYYANWCPHCTTTLPEFDKIATNGTVTVNGKVVHCVKYEADASPDVIQSKNIQGFPTLRFESAEGKIIDYKGPRDAEGFLKFLNEQLGGGIQ